MNTYAATELLKWKPPDEDLIDPSMQLDENKIARMLNILISVSN